MKKRARKRPRARIPLPRKTEKSHGDASVYERSREKRRLRHELERSEPDRPT